MHPLSLTRIGFIGILLMILIYLSIHIVGLATAPDWNSSQVEARLGLIIPSDAENLVYDGFIQEGFRLSLSFISSARSAYDFSAKACDNTLYVGYDPFNAENTSIPWSFAHMIHLYQFIYYSYSENASQAVSGNRCISEKGILYQVQIQAVSTSQSSVHFEATTWCNYCYQYLTSGQKLFRELPLHFFGLKLHQPGQLFLDHRELCVAVEAGWSNVLPIGTQLAFRLNEHYLGSASVDASERLSSRIDSYHNPIAISLSGDANHFCMPILIERGEYQLMVSVNNDYELVSEDRIILELAVEGIE